MNDKTNDLKSEKLLSTNYIKAFAIVLIVINHTLNYSVSMEMLRELRDKYFLNFWVYQAVSLFIVVTGIHYSKSIEKLINKSTKNNSFESSIISWYSTKSFMKKMGRLWIPYTIEQIVWLIYYRFIKKGQIGKEIFFKYISGGVGPGGYYTICMIQIIVLFPILYYLVKKYKIIGIMSIITVNIIYEIMVKFEWITTTFDRLCSVRLFTGLMLGIIIYLYYDKIRNTVIPWIWFIFGAGVLTWNLGGGYKLQFTASWVSSSFAVVPYAAGIVWLVTRQDNRIVLLCQKYSFINVISTGITYIGKATYHIFLVQQFYFCLNIYNRTKIGLLQASLIDIIICVVVGCIFYYFYTKCELFCTRKWDKIKMVREHG